MTRDFVRVLVMGDTHCGHRAGLTPPHWWQQPDPESILPGLQRRLWGGFKAGVNACKPIDLLLHMGDAIDGKGTRSGGTELLTTDRAEQVKMAVQCIAQVEAPKVIMVYGTPYHVGVEEDWEDEVAEKAKAEIHDQAWPQVYNTVFDIAHKIGSSSIPHGRGTALAREKLWNGLWAEHEEQPRANILLRGHVHYRFVVGEPGGWHAYTCPALQAAATKYGGRQCSGTVHLGFYTFDVYPDSGGDAVCQYHPIARAVRKCKTIKVA